MSEELGIHSRQEEIETFELKPPPECPQCGEPLETIHIDTCGEVLDWNDEKGCYESYDAQLIETYYCPSCGKAVGGWRADGETWGFVPEVE